MFDQYEKKTEEIALFIQTAEEQKDFVETVEVNPKTEAFVAGLRKLSNSVVLYNAAIISIYGSYEMFLDEALKSYLVYLKKWNKLYAEFPERLRKKHISKSAEFLSNPQRFLNMGLSNEDVIIALEASYVKGQSAPLLDDLLLSHSGNLNTKQLNEQLKEYGFEKPIHKLLKHTPFKDLCIGNRPIEIEGGTVFPILDQLVDERNKVGHGWIAENRLSFSLLRERYLPFVIGLCDAVKDLIVSKIIQDYIDSNFIKQFDPIIHVWKNGEIIGVNSKSFRLKVGEQLYYSTDDDWNYPFLIVNIQNDRQDRTEIRAVNKDITIQTDRKMKENYTIWGYTR